MDTKTFSNQLQLDRLEEQGRYRYTHEKGKGLYLNISKDGTRSWLFRYQLNGKRRWLGLGSYSASNGLADAVKQISIHRASIVKGIDPVVEKRESREQEREKDHLARQEKLRNKQTFGVCAEEYLEKKQAEWSNAKHRQQWANTLSTYAYPFLGEIPVRDITTDDVKKCLDPIWYTKTETATRVRQRIQSVLGYAIASGYRTDSNPAIWSGLLQHMYADPTKLKAELRTKRGKTEHHPALSYSELPGFISELVEMEGFAALALRFTILTAARTSEVRFATWDEFDFKKKIWDISKERMKARVAHRVALSDAAIGLLEGLPRMSEYVFPGGKVGKPMSNAALSAVLKRMGRKDITVHGFRSTFRDYIGEETSFPYRVAEFALAHRLTDSAEKAYARGDLLEKRFKMMNTWASYVDSNTDNVEWVKFVKRA